MQHLKYTLYLFTFILFCIFTIACTFDTAVDPVELDHTVSGYGYYNKATLDSGRTFHLESSPLPIKIEQLYKHSECSFDSITTHTFTSKRYNDSNHTDTTQTDSITIFNVGYIIHATNSPDPNCVTQEAVNDTTLILEPIWENAKQVNIHSIIITKITESISDTTKTPITSRDTTYIDTNISVLDTILLVSGNYNEKSISFAIDSLFNIQSNFPLEGKDFSTPILQDGILLDYEYQSYSIETIDSVEWKSSYCLDSTEVRDCETQITLDIKTEKKLIGITVIDTIISVTNDTTYVSIDTIVTIEKPFTNIKQQIHQHICYDTVALAPIYRVRANDTTALADSIMLSICDTALFKDTTLIDSLNPNDSVSIEQIIAFYEQCIKEEEIVCATYPDCMNGNNNNCIVFDTIIFDETIADTTFTLPVYEEKTTVTERTKCLNGNAYCIGDTHDTTIFPDTLYYDTTFFYSVAYLEEINQCDSINFNKINRNQYQYNGYIELYRELFEIDDSYHCSDGSDKLDTLVWDLGTFKKIIPSELKHEHDGESVDLRDTILSQLRDTLDHVKSIKR